MFKKAILIGAMLVATTGAQAQSAGFSVTGVVTPPSCTLTLGGGNTVMDFGNLSKATVKSYTVNSANHYVMVSKSLTYSVVCSGATKVGLEFTDNYAGKIVAIDGDDSYRWGVVDGTGTTGIGSYFFLLTSPTIDGSAPAGYLETPNGTTTWSTGTSYTQPGYSMSFIKVAGQTVPQQITTASGSLVAMVSLSKPYVDAATSTINIKAGGTITLQYL